MALERTIRKAGIALVHVPAGVFTMGQDYLFDDEKPVHETYLSAFWIGKTEVTVEQFRRFCEDGAFDYHWERHKPPLGWQDDYPMVNVTWDEAWAFCRWAGGDLPTEAQWEKAARGTDSRWYPWGNHCDYQKAITSAGSCYVFPWDEDKDVTEDMIRLERHHAEPVGSRPAGASPYECLDMVGNVREWCYDAYRPGGYDPGFARNPRASWTPQIDIYRVKEVVVRGGSWRSRLDEHCRCAFRSFQNPGDRAIDLGFRIAVRWVAPASFAGQARRIRLPLTRGR